MSAEADVRSAHAREQQTGGADGSPDVPDTPQPDETQNKVITLPQAIFHDQIGMWTSPSKVRYSDATWLVPLGGLTAAFFVTDSDFSRHLSADPNTQTTYRHISDYGAYSVVGGAAGTYFLGLMTHNEHQRESGFLSGEAAIDSLIAVEALKLVTGRQRPYQDNGDGQFWKGGGSFPSEHAAAVWSIAGIMAHEYSSPLMKFLAYGMASTVGVGPDWCEAAFSVRCACGCGHRIPDQRIRVSKAPQARTPGGPLELSRSSAGLSLEVACEVHGFALRSAEQLDLPGAGATRRPWVR